MTWQGFLNGSSIVLNRVCVVLGFLWWLTLKILVLLLKVAVLAVKVVFFIAIAILTLGKLSGSTIDLGGRR